RLDVLGVDVRLSTAVSAADLSGYDEVVVATGVTPRAATFDGADHPKVVSYADAISGAVGDPALHPGAITEKKPRTPAREVWLLQRKTTPIGKGLAKTSGWAHRAV